MVAVVGHAVDICAPVSVRSFHHDVVALDLGLKGRIGIAGLHQRVFDLDKTIGQGRGLACLAAACKFQLHQSHGCVFGVILASQVSCRAAGVALFVVQPDAEALVVHSLHEVVELRQSKRGPEVIVIPYGVGRKTAKAEFGKGLDLIGRGLTANVLEVVLNAQRAVFVFGSCKGVVFNQHSILYFCS